MQIFRLLYNYKGRKLTADHAKVQATSYANFKYKTLKYAKANKAG